MRVKKKKIEISQERVGRLPYREFNVFFGPIVVTIYVVTYMSPRASRVIFVPRRHTSYVHYDRSE